MSEFVNEPVPDIHMWASVYHVIRPCACRDAGAGAHVRNARADPAKHRSRKRDCERTQIGFGIPSRA